jgi:hypothetical protein
MRFIGHSLNEAHRYSCFVVSVESVMFESVCHCHQYVIDSVPQWDLSFTIVGKIMAYFQKLFVTPVLIVLVSAAPLYIPPLKCVRSV